MQGIRIAVILDKPKHAQVALERTLTLDYPAETKVSLFSFCWDPLASSSSGIDASEKRALRVRLLKDQRNWLLELRAGRNLEAGVFQSKVIWSSDIAGWVSENVSKSDYDLIVKSANPTGTLLHTPLDWSLLAQSKVPLLLTQAGQRKGKPRSGKTVLAAIDLRNTDAVHQKLNRKVLRNAQMMAEALSAKVHCVSVVEYSKILSDLDIVDRRKVKQRFMIDTLSAREELLSEAGVPASRTHYPAGKVSPCINQIARKLKAECLVVGTIARRGQLALRLGNSAQRILSRAVCDVLAVPP